MTVRVHVVWDREISALHEEIKKRLPRFSNDERLADAVFRGMSESMIRAAARQYVLKRVWHERREGQRRLEHEEHERILRTRKDEQKKRKQWRQERQKEELEEAKAAGFETVYEWRSDQMIKASLLLREMADAWTITQSLLDSVFALGDGRRVTWREATIADHQTRIRYMWDKVDGHKEDIELHEVAVILLKTNDVRCLGDLPEERIPLKKEAIGV